MLPPRKETNICKFDHANGDNVDGDYFSNDSNRSSAESTLLHARLLDPDWLAARIHADNRYMGVLFTAEPSDIRALQNTEPKKVNLVI